MEEEDIDPTCKHCGLPRSTHWNGRLIQGPHVRMELQICQTSVFCATDAYLTRQGLMRTDTTEGDE